MYGIIEPIGLPFLSSFPGFSLDRTYQPAINISVLVVDGEALSWIKISFSIWSTLVMCSLEEVWRVTHLYHIVNVKEGEKERKKRKEEFPCYYLDKIRKGLK